MKTACGGECFPRISLRGRHCITISAQNEPKDLIIYHILEYNSHHNGDGKFLYYYDGNTEFGGFALISGTFVFVAYDDEYNFGEPRFQDFTVTPDTAAEGATDPEEFVKLFPEFFYNLN